MTSDNNPSANTPYVASRLARYKYPAQAPSKPKYRARARRAKCSGTARVLVLSVRATPRPPHPAGPLLSLSLVSSQVPSHGGPPQVPRPPGRHRARRVVAPLLLRRRESLYPISLRLTTTGSSPSIYLILTRWIPVFFLFPSSFSPVRGGRAVAGGVRVRRVGADVVRRADRDGARRQGRAVQDRGRRRDQGGAELPRRGLLRGHRRHGHPRPRRPGTCRMPSLPADQSLR